MKYGEAWLLETLVLFRLSVGNMMRTERSMNEWLNRGYHRLSKVDLVSTLTHLFQIGDIDAYNDSEMKEPADLEDFLRALDNRSSPMHCGVSSRGGKRWEELAKPDWNRFFEDIGWDGQTVQITTGTKERLLELVANAGTLWDCRMDIDSGAIEELAPREPIVWKTLPHGVTANVHYEKNLFTPRPRDHVNEEFRNRLSRYTELRSWATSICGHAYV